MDVFKKNLEEFAAKHKDDIRKDPQFRLQFQEMCASIGVDPLACKYPHYAVSVSVIAELVHYYTPCNEIGGGRGGGVVSIGITLLIISV